MNRRTVIRNIAFISAGIAILPSCLHHDSVASFPLKNLRLSGAQQDMLASLSETILPATSNFIGAKDLKAHEFILKMVDDCFNPDDQKKFTNGLNAFEKFNRDKFGGNFTSNSTPQKNELLTAMEAKKDVPEEVLNFYSTVKRYTVQCFTSSKNFMTDIRHYKMVPGSKFKGCVPVKNA
jgi:hypothetical protein